MGPPLCLVEHQVQSQTEKCLGSLTTTSILEADPRNPMRSLQVVLRSPGIGAEEASSRRLKWAVAQLFGASRRGFRSASNASHLTVGDRRPR